MRSKRVTQIECSVDQVGKTNGLARGDTCRHLLPLWPFSCVVVRVVCVCVCVFVFVGLKLASNPSILTHTYENPASGVESGVCTIRLASYARHGNKFKYPSWLVLS